jgi:hypothetical protein
MLPQKSVKVRTTQQIEVESNEATKFGEEWRDSTAVSRVFSLSLDQTLQGRSKGSEMNRFLEKDPLMIFEELEGNH